jgi:hypothetical protein
MTDESAGGDLVVAERSSSATDYSGEGAGALKRKAQSATRQSRGGKQVEHTGASSKKPGRQPGLRRFLTFGAGQLR